MGLGKGASALTSTARAILRSTSTAVSVSDMPCRSSTPDQTSTERAHVAYHAVRTGSSLTLAHDSSSLHRSSRSGARLAATSSSEASNASFTARSICRSWFVVAPSRYSRSSVRVRLGASARSLNAAPTKLACDTAPALCVQSRSGLPESESEASGPEYGSEHSAAIRRSSWRRRAAKPRSPSAAADSSSAANPRSRNSRPLACNRTSRTSTEYWCASPDAERIAPDSKSSSPPPPPPRRGTKAAPWPARPLTHRGTPCSCGADHAIADRSRSVTSVRQQPTPSPP
mmetsp:Transcript_38746/g.119137  ORF Transcript_38746/g.119137 Transcript_38746/m.119137 type:complete len:286 (+) Transcript_38746:198-1055(+)